VVVTAQARPRRAASAAAAAAAMVHEVNPFILNPKF